jgi:5'-3' exonuclease
LNVLNYCCIYALEKGASHGALLFDGDDNFRLKVYRKYKSNRGRAGGGASLDMKMDGETTTDEVYASLEPTIRLFQLVGYPVVQMPAYEADDLCAAGGHSFANESEDHLSWMVCRDKDAFQSVTDRVKVYWPAVGLAPAADVDAAYVRKKTGMDPRTFGDYQILIGDSTDAVPAILSPAKAKAILKEHGLLGRFFKTEEGKTFFLRHEQALRRNQQLVRMDHRSWQPTAADISMRLKEPKEVMTEFGKLPKSFYALRSVVSSGSRSLFWEL